LIAVAVLTWARVAEAAPAGSDSYRIYVFAAAALLVLELVLIAALMIGRQRLIDRHRAERRAAEEERRTRVREDEHRRDQLLSTVAHELRNGLAPIPMGIEILRQVPMADERLVWAREMIADQVTEMARLVENLLDTARIAVGAVDLRLTATDLASVARDAVQASAPALAKRAVEARLPAEPVWVRGDAARLTKVVSALLGHAARQTRAGGRMWLSVETSETHGVLVVRDDGDGLTPEQLGRLFEVGAVTSAARRWGGDGGFGLPLVKQIVTMHAGSIEARSAGPDRGAELVVRLPMATATGATPVKPASGESSRPLGDSERRRILVVDDDVHAAESLRRVLCLRQHEVEVVHDGLQALEAAGRMIPEVVLLDIDLPALNGLEVARRLRAAPNGGRILLVATTGLGGEDDRRSTREAGFDHHLVKPIDLAALEALLLDAPQR
jgi:signal transduction histidine kinase/CheY-like chemotaxis protein